MSPGRQGCPCYGLRGSGCGGGGYSHSKSGSSRRRKYWWWFRQSLSVSIAGFIAAVAAFV